MSEDELQQTRREPRWARFRSRSALVNSSALADALNRCDASPGSSTRSLKVPRLVELLVEHPAKFELPINLKTAKAQSLAHPARDTRPSRGGERMRQRDFIASLVLAASGIEGEDHFSASLRPPSVLWTLPSSLSALPSDLSLESPTA